jgi:hypothetical protein
VIFALRNQSPVFKSRVYKLVGYVPWEISNSKKVWNISFAPIGSHSGTLPLKFANLGLKYWGQSYSYDNNPWRIFFVAHINYFIRFYRIIFLSRVGAGAASKCNLFKTLHCLSQGNWVRAGAAAGAGARPTENDAAPQRCFKN